MNGSSSLDIRAMALVERALDQPTSDRVDWIKRETSGEPELAARALDLFDLLGEGERHLATGGAGDVEHSFEAPEQIGDYRVIEMLGQGGMGAVFKAERATGDFEHLVAIKVIRPGALSGPLIARFERERQILASLTHPNIARLYDGGTTKDGGPFIVMEYIEGVPLNKWANSNNLSVNQRLALMKGVCEAVGFAHQNLIIHRDLTPNNILVTSEGTPKLIDFGIARPQEDRAEAPSENAAPLSLTPGFAAPERYQGKEATTLSDIYSLGMLISRLVADKTIDADLQAIIAMATSEKPDERYGSAGALLRDIEAYLTGYPVTARNAGRAYTLRKFVARERFAVAAVATIAMLTFVAFAATAIGFQRARVAQAEAEDRLADTRDMANLMMFDVFDEVSRVPGTTSARLLIARNAQRYLDQLAADADASLDARIAAGRGYYRLASVTGAMDASNTGDLMRGVELFERSVELLEAVRAQAATDEIRLALAQSYIGLMRVKALGYLDIGEAIEHGWKARDLLMAMDSQTVESVAARAQVDRYLGDNVAGSGGQPQRGYELIEEGIAFVDSMPAEIRADPAVRRSRNDLINLRAGLAIFRGELADGLPHFYAALDAQSQLTRETEEPEDYRLEATIANNLARTLLFLEREAEAERVLAPVHGRALVAYEIDRNDNELQRRLAIVSLARSWIAAERGATQRAERYLREGLRFAQLADWPQGLRSLPSLNYAHRLQEAFEAQWALGRTQEACATMRRSIAMYEAYADRFELPETAWRYRISRMTSRADACSDWELALRE